MKFNEMSYEMQAHHWINDGRDPQRLEVHKTWFREDTIDFWRHRRMMDVIFEVFSVETKHSRWLTLGDGRYGLDAIRMLRRGFVNVTATDLQDGLLRVARDAGLIDHISKENAEKLSFLDDSYDYALCKDAFHHFPRPYLALYEMLRVCTKAVVLVEPQDPYIDLPSLADTRRPGYEADGNFVYQTSRREIEKVALGMNLPAIAFKNFVDKYIAGLEFESAHNDNPKFTEHVDMIHGIEHQCKMGKMKYNYMSSIVFLEMPSEKIRKELDRKGYDFIELIRNPYVKI